MLYLLKLMTGFIFICPRAKYTIIVTSGNWIENEPVLTKLLLVLFKVHCVANLAGEVA